LVSVETASLKEEPQMADVLARPLHADWEEEFPVHTILNAFEAEEWEDDEWEDEDEWEEDEDEEWDDEDDEWEDEDEWEEDEGWDDNGGEVKLGRRQHGSDWN
jgi:hypothetical protein